MIVWNRNGCGVMAVLLGIEVSATVDAKCFRAAQRCREADPMWKNSSGHDGFGVLLQQVHGGGDTGRLEYSYAGTAGGTS